MNEARKMIRPVSDLRNNFADISRTVHETQKPVFLTKNGFCKIIGNVCMDLTMIEDKTKSLKKGDEVIILGDNGKKSVKADDMAKICDTIPYEIVCNLRNRR